MELKDYPVSAEQYLIKQYEGALESNKNLSNTISLLEEKLQSLQPLPQDEETEDIIVLPELMLLYAFSTYRYNISRTNIEDYEKILEKTEFYYDDNSNYYITSQVINAKIKILDQLFYCYVTFKGRDRNNEITVYDLDKFEKTYEDAKNKLLLQLRKDIDSQKEKFLKEDAEKKEI